MNSPVRSEGQPRERLSSSQSGSRARVGTIKKIECTYIFCSTGKDIHNVRETELKQCTSIEQYKLGRASVTAVG